MAEIADSVLVDKLNEKLYLMKSGNIIAEYSVAFGGNHEGHKQQDSSFRRLAK